MGNAAAEALLVLIGIVIIVGIIGIASSVYVIEDGHVGVKKTWGKISNEELYSGLGFKIPIIETIEIYDVKTQETNETSEVPSSEGLIVSIDASVLYHLENTKVAELRKSVNTNFKETLIIPYIRNEFRDTISGYEAKAIYSQIGRKEIAEKIKENLIENLESRGVIIEAVLLRSLTLPQNLTNSIELKLQTEQNTLQKEFELLSAEKDAEIQVARARGIAESNEIIADSISREYVMYLWVQGLNDGNSEVIYVPTEGNLPVLEATRLG